MDIETGLGPHNIAFNPTGTRAIVSTKGEDVATLIDTGNKDPKKWEVITTDIASGIENNGVRWVPSPKAINTALKAEPSNKDNLFTEIASN